MDCLQLVNLTIILSTAAKGSFHGTDISLFHFTTSSNAGEKQNDIKLPVVNVMKNYQLPDSFTTLLAMTLKVTEMSVPQLSKESVPKVGKLADALSKQKSWLKHASELLEKDEVEKGDTVAWSAFYALK